MDLEVQTLANQRIALQLGQLLIESISANARVEILARRVLELEEEKPDGGGKRPKR